MSFFPKISYWRPLVSNAEMQTRQPIRLFKTPHIPPVLEDEAEFVLVKHIFQYASVSLCSQQHKKIKKFASEIFKRTRSGKTDVKEAPHIEGSVNKNIQEK